jgi:hypothetical protein
MVLRGRVEQLARVFEVRAGALTSRCVAAAMVAGMLTGCGSGASSGVANGRVAPGHVAPGERVAPYVDMTLTARAPDLARAAASGGVRIFTLAFITAGASCEPTWGGVLPYDDPGIGARIRQLRQAGGDVRVSFGGARPPDLAERCGSRRALEAAYRKVIDAFGVVRVDFDVEGRGLADSEVVHRRNEAIHALQATAKRRGDTLRVSYTPPAGPGSLPEEAAALLRDARSAGVTVDAVNVLAMDYGTASSDMAGRAIAVATSTQALIRELWPGTSDGDAWRMVAITPMIGVNDTVPETFRPEDAARLVRFAEQHGVGWLSFWSMNRDQPCPAGPLPAGPSTPAAVWASEPATSPRSSPGTPARPVEPLLAGCRITHRTPLAPACRWPQIGSQRAMRRLVSKG